MLSEKTLAGNLAALKKRNPGLARSLAGADCRSNCEITPTRSGHYTARIAAADGRSITLHSAYDPVKEATRFVDAKGFGERDNYVLMGFGLGYVAEEILNRLATRQQAIIIEADLSLLRTALSLRDLAPLLSSEKIHLWAGDDPARFSAFITAFFDDAFIEDITVIKYPPSLLLNAAFYASAETEVRNAANKRVVDLQTAITLGPVCQGNILANSLHYLEHPGIMQVQGAFTGKPAIVVAAGPSLDKNVHLLAKASDRAVIICVGTVLKKLLSAGVRPHVVVSMDPDEISYRYFEDIEGSDGIVLAADPEVCPTILEKYPGPKLLIGINTPETGWLDTFTPPKGTLAKGRSVAHTAFYLARYLGADPIILAGLDLCFPGGRAHADGCNIAWGDELDVEKETGLVTIRGIDGLMHPARKNFLNFLTIFENEFARTKARVIDATEGGALKRGAEIMTLAEALERFAASPVDTSTLLKAASTKPRSDFDSFASAVADACRHIETIIATCKEALKILKRMRRTVEESGADAPQVKKLTRRVNHCHEELDAFRHLIPMIQRNMLETKLYFEKREVAQIADMPFGDERLLKEIERGRVFFGGNLRSASYLRPHLLKLKNAVRNAVADTK